MPERTNDARDRPDVVNRDLDRLRPDFRRRLLATIAQANRETAGKFADFAEWVLFEGWRSPARQQWLYAQGRTRPGPVVTWTTQSRHTTGKAADVVWKDTRGRYRWDGPPELWQRLGHAARANGLEWGGDWTANPDRPHVQARTAR